MKGEKYECFSLLFVVVVAVSCKDEHYDFCVVNLIDEAMLLGDTATPLSVAIACQRLWLAGACARMLAQFLYQRLCLLKSLGSFLANAIKSRAASLLNSTLYVIANPA